MVHNMIQNRRIGLTFLLTAFARINLGALGFYNPGLQHIADMVSRDVYTAILLLVKPLITVFKRTLDFRLLLGMYHLDMSV